MPLSVMTGCLSCMTITYCDPMDECVVCEGCGDVRETELGETRQLLRKAEEEEAAHDLQ